MKIMEMLRKSGFLHTPLAVSDFADGDLAKQRSSSPIEAEVKLSGTVSLCGRGALERTRNGWKTTCALHLAEWPPAQQPDGDYCNFGCTGMVMEPKQKDWNGYTRLRFSAKATGIGNRVPHINIHLKNEGEIPMPDEFGRTGTHLVALEYGEWVDCIWEIAELPRDWITRLDISLSLNGSDNMVGKDASLEIKDLVLQKTVPYRNYGWECAGISYSQSGYRINGQKQAVTMIPCETFSVEKRGETVVNFVAKPVVFKEKNYRILDFSEIREEGMYRIICGEQISEWFPIEKEPFMEAALKLCNFIFCERCGYPVPRTHGICHCDVTVEHEGKKLIYNGGWHDAGDLSQQTLQTGEISSSLYHAADAAIKNEEFELADRLLEEARWGMAFVLKTRFGDGYRATSAGLTRYTHSFIGDMDDIYARCHNNPFENFLFSAIESDAAEHEMNLDPSLSDQLWQAAKEDFFFGVERLPYLEERNQSFFEHSYASSRSLHLAAAIYAGCNLLKRESENRIWNIVEDYIREMLACQETSDRYAVSGFFYRDTEKVVPVHFNHQSREYLFAQALVSAYEATEGTLREQVFAAMRSYGEQFKQLMKYASPYGMLPAGVYLMQEAEDRTTFPYLHLFADYDVQKDNMIKQIQNGVPAGVGAYVRQFPVWFSFRGNFAIILSQAMGCQMLGRVLRDDILCQIADEQLYFICGKNPFAQSMIYGEGNRYAPQYAANPGQMIGEIPVGIETYGNADDPFYPEACNATYKEVWTTPAARFLGTL